MRMTTRGETTKVAPKEQAKDPRISQAKVHLFDATLERAACVAATKGERHSRLNFQVQGQRLPYFKGRFLSFFMHC